MSNREAEFLVGADLSNRIREICAVAEVDCAVAFWGVEMRKTLFPAWDQNRVRILCDVSMGATSRSALEELDAPDNQNLKVVDKLHAKVFISANGAVIGSSNATDNGVGRREGESGNLIEAGIFCPPESSAHLEAQRWFDRSFDDARVLGTEDLERAPSHSGELLPRARAAELQQLPLLSRIRSYPQNFPGLHIALASGYIDDKMARASKRQRAAARGAASRDLKDDVILQKGDGTSLLPFNGTLLLLWRGRSVTYVQAYTGCSTWPPTDPDTVFGIEDWDAFWQSFDQEPSKDRLTSDESGLIGRLLEEEEGEWLFSAEAFADTLARAE